MRNEPFLYRIVRPILCLLFYVLYRPIIIGQENVPKDGRVVLAGNHTNNLDCILLIISCKRVIHFLAKEELIKGVFGFIFKCMGIIPVNRKIHDKEALNSAISCLNEDKVIGIFPEGTFNHSDDVILPFKIGAVKMASETGSPIVPFVIKGEYKIFKRKIKLEFLEPINVPLEKDLTSYNQELMDIVSDKLRRE